MPLPFAAGEPSKVFRLGMLSFTPPGPGIRALERRLQTLGSEEGRNLRIDYVQLDDADINRSLAMAAELVGRGVDTIYAAGAELAVKSAVTATRTVPVVMIAIDYDPVARGYVASLARPGGNVTGVFLQQIELTPKRLEFLAGRSWRAPGIIRAIEECLPRSLRQRCLAHKTRNLQSKVPEDVWPEFKARAAACYQAASPADFRRP
jgi:hypothetical protein